MKTPQIQYFDSPDGVVLDDSRIFLEDVKQLKNHEQRIVLNMLVYAAILDGKVTIRERRLLETAFRNCNQSFDYKEIRGYLNAFRSGLLIDFKIGN